MGHIREVGDGVFAIRYNFYDQQIGAVIGDDGVLVIDTRTSHRQADDLRADIRRISKKPVTLAVNTHGHSDHCFGNHRFRPAPIWAHVRCASMLEATGERQRRGLVRNYPERAAEFREVVIDPPDQTFEDRATVEAGGRPVELAYLGRGHTDNDIVVRVPDADVVFAGDLLENGAPPSFGDGFPLEWPATLERLVPMIDGVVVPGHGEVADRAFAERQLDEIRTLVALAHAVQRAEFGLDMAVARAPYGPAAARGPIERTLAQLRGEVA